MFKPRWILFRSAAYLGGRGLTLGDEIVPHNEKAPGKYSISIDLFNTPTADVVDTSLSCFADKQFDHVFLGPRIEIVNQPEEMFRLFARKLAIGGHLIIASEVNKEGAAQKYNPERVKSLVASCGRWKTKAEYLRDNWLLFIYKRIEGKTGIEPITPKTTKPRVCVCRYGALGDIINISPLLHQLADDGYEVTLNAAPYCLPAIKHNPYIHNIIPQEKEIIPVMELGDYWNEWKNDYDRYINLSESIEGRFLKVEGRRDFYTPKEWRIKTGDHNYYDAAMRLGGYPNITGKQGELFFSNAEERSAQKFFSQFKNKFTIIWPTNGSSHHKIYPNMQIVIEDWLVAHDDSVIITVGDKPVNMEYQHQRLIHKETEWSIREALIGAKYANLVIGPETMMTNAAGSLGTPTITMLSHSTHNALCKYWVNDYCIAPDTEVAPCYPCFQLHYSKDSCPIRQVVDASTNEVLSEAPACAMDGISTQRLYARIEEVYYQHFKAKNGKIEPDATLRQMDSCSTSHVNT